MSVAPSPDHAPRPPAGTVDLYEELLTLIAVQARRAWIAVLAIDIVLALLIGIRLHTVWPVAWLGLVLASSYLHVRVVDGARISTRPAPGRLRRVAASFAGRGVILVLPLLALPALPTFERLVLSLYCISLVTATLHAVMGYAQIYRPYLLATLGPLTGAWLMVPGQGFAWISPALMIPIYAAGVLGHARGVWQLFSDACRMRNEQLLLTEELRQALKRAEDASNAKTRFLASANHDLRQPIHALRLFGGTLLAQPLEPRAERLVKQMNNILEVLSGQMETLLDISRLDARVVDIHPVPVEIAPFLENLAASIEPLAAEKGLRLSCSGPPGVVVEVDPALLERLLQNLLSNALRYTQAGRIELVASAPDKHGRLRIGVTDTGQGIPESLFETIFEEFYQINNAARDRQQGLGLGLAIVGRLARLLDTRVEVASTVGQGSTFSLALPVLPGCPRRPGPALSRAASLALAPLPRRVLVVDDEADVLDATLTLLETFGCTPEGATGSDAALAAVRREMPDVVLTDLRLRDDDNGFALIEVLRTAWPELPVIVVTGDSSPDRLRQARATALPVLHKPVGLDELRTALAQARAATERPRHVPESVPVPSLVA